MGTRIVVMKDGFIQQVDTPQNLYSKPTNMFVAGFIGSPQMNFIDATMAKKDGRYVVEFGDDTSKFEVVIPESKKNDALDEYIGKEVVLGVRPEDLKDEEIIVNSATTGLIDCNVEVTELMGAETYLYVQCAGVNMTARVSPRSTARPGDVIKMAINVNNIHLFDKETEKVILN